VKVRVLILVAFAIAMVSVLVAFTEAQQTASSGSAGVNLTVSQQVRDMGKNFPLPPGAKQATSIGSPGQTVNTKNSDTDTDSVWVQEIDVDGDGNVEKADFLWDDEDKVLYISYQDDYVCKNGGTGKGAVLIGINGEGNARNRPVGSGFYTVTLDKSECGSETAGQWGCKFNANGNPTACGVAVLDEKNDDLTVAAASN
jgi:hypothetical protein